MPKPIAFLVAALVVLMVVPTAHAGPVTSFENGTSRAIEVAFVKSDGAVESYPVPPDKCLTFCYEGSTAGDSCDSDGGKGKACKDGGGICLDIEPQQVIIDNLRIYPIAYRPPREKVAAIFERHPDWKRVTDVYHEAFCEEFNGKLVPVTNINEQWEAAKKEFEDTHTEVLETVDGKRIEIPHHNSRAYESVEFDERGNPKAIWRFASEPTVSLVIDGHIVDLRTSLWDANEKVSAAERKEPAKAASNSHQKAASPRAPGEKNAASPPKK